MDEVSYSTRRKTGGRQPTNPDDPAEYVRYVYEDGGESVRRYGRSTIRCPEKYRQWVGSALIWPDEFVEWWMNFCDTQARTVEAQNPGRFVDHWDLVTGEET